MSQFDAEVTVRRTRYVSDATGWAVLDASTATAAAGRARRPARHLEERERAHVIGTWVDDSRYGRQVKVSEAHPLPPDDAETLIAYLCRVKHVGKKRAQELIDRYGTAGVLDAIDRDPRRRSRRSGCAANGSPQAAQSWAALRVTRQLHLLLAPHGLAYLVARIHAEYGSSAPPRGARAPLRADERVRRRLPARRPDRARHRGPADSRERARAGVAAPALARPSAAAAPACRSIAADRNARELLGRAARRGADRRARARRRPGPRGGLDLPPPDRRARGRARRRGSRSSRAPTADTSTIVCGEPDGAGDRRHRAHRRAARGRAQRVRPPAVADHRRSGHRQDGVDQDDRRARGRPGRPGAAGRAHRPGGDQDDRGERRSRAHRPFGTRLDSRRGPDARRGRPAATATC